MHPPNHLKDQLLEIGRSTRGTSGGGGGGRGNRGYDSDSYGRGRNMGGGGGRDGGGYSSRGEPDMVI